MEFFTEQRELLVAKCTRGQSNFLCLLVKGLQNRGMTVPLIHSGIRSQAVEITLALDVIHPDAVRALDHNVEGMIVMGSVAVFEFNEVLSV